MNATGVQTAPAVEFKQLGIDAKEDALFLDYYEHQFAYLIEIQSELKEDDQDRN